MLTCMRWGAADIQQCQKDDCGAVESHYWIASRKQWRCKVCSSSFSVTSNTIFADHKKPVNDIVLIIYLFATSPKGAAALQISHWLKMTEKAAWVICHKLREAMIAHEDPTPLEGEVEIDGARFNASMRKANHKKNRRDARLEKHQNPNRVEMIAMRQRGLKGEGASRSKVGIVRRESDPETIAVIKDSVARTAHVITDAAPVYNLLLGSYRISTVNHDECYSNALGVNQNQAESFFARVRRGEMGQYHRFSKQYLHTYGSEFVFREDKRRWDDARTTRELIAQAISTPRDRSSFVGYWQRSKRAAAREIDTIAL